MSHGIPDGYAVNAASGLILPEAVALRREVWTRDEWRALDKTIRLCKKRGIAFLMRCGACSQPMGDSRAPSGDVLLSCGCTERVFTRRA